MIVQFATAAFCGLVILLGGFLLEMAVKPRGRVLASLIMAIGVAGLLGCAAWWTSL